jgi:hypothetical protein
MNILDIDKDIGNPQMCASYVVAIYSNLMASEVGYAFLLKEMFLSSVIKVDFCIFYISIALSSLKKGNYFGSLFHGFGKLY